MLEDVKAGLSRAELGVVATTPEYKDVMNHDLRVGRFLTPADEATTAAVCVLGSKAARTLFPLASPVEQVVAIGDVYFRVVGVLQAKGATGTTGALSNPDDTVWIPFSTSFARFGNLQVRTGQGSSEATQVEVHRAVLALAPGIDLREAAAVAEHLVKERHPKEDVSVTVPLALLAEQRQAEHVFRWVMGSLAAISLLVGGIGIMNIMLANMAERRQEIGLRRALGATQSDIVQLFVSESLVICFLGGVLGVLLGVGLALLVSQLAQWSVVLTPLSFPLGVLVSAATGLIFGTFPALKAARLDPMLALRVE